MGAESRACTFRLAVLVVVGSDAVIADVRVGEGDDLAAWDGSVNTS
jgi:hypothetical protein